MSLDLIRALLIVVVLRFPSVNLRAEEVGAADNQSVLGVVQLGCELTPIHVSPEPLPHSPVAPQLDSPIGPGVDFSRGRRGPASAMRN